MILAEHKLDFGRGKLARVLATSCWHLGNPNICEAGLRTCLDRARKMPWLMLGDITDAILPDDRRFDISALAEAFREYVAGEASSAKESVALLLADVLSQVMAAARYFKRARETCLGVLKSNHDGQLSRRIGNVPHLVADWAEVPYLSETTYQTFITPQGRSLFFAAHGSKLGAGGRAGKPHDRLRNWRRKLQYFFHHIEADIILAGHVHRFYYCPPEAEQRIMPATKNTIIRRPVPLDPRWYVTVPTFLRNYRIGTIPNYAEEGLMEPSDLGWVEVVINRQGVIEAVEYRNEHNKVAKCIERE